MVVKQEVDWSRGEGGEVVFSWGATYGRGRAAFSSLNMYRLYNPEPWHRYRHLLPASLCQSTVYTQTSASPVQKKKKKRGHTALDRSAFRHSAWPPLAGSLHKNLNASCQAISR